ncbi:MAG: S9 family peptidase [Candidatus Aminicenantes bacterium]|nr:S9 family peptidase [Candidatus Aminicenantes bacterium]
MTVKRPGYNLVFSIFIIFSLIYFWPGLGAQPVEKKAIHPFSVHDLLAMERISDPQVSPDGRWLVFTLWTADLEANRGRTDLWLIGTDGQNLRRLTTHPASDFNPRWSPCGHFIWFLSTRSGSSQVWQINLTGGEAIQITDFPLDVSNLLVSPDGRYLAFTMEVFPDNSCPFDTKRRLDELAKKKSSGRIYDRLFIRHWDSWKDGRRSHLFAFRIEDKKLFRLMAGMDADTPSKPFGGPEEITFTPDSQGLIFTAKNVGREEAWSTDFDLYHVSVDGSKPPVCLTEDNPAWDTTPLFSPDGKTLAYLAMKRPGYESDRYRIVLRDWVSGKEKVLTENWDRSPTEFAWAPDSRFIYAVAPNIGQQSLFGIDVQTGQVKTILYEGYVTSPRPLKDKLIFGLDNLKSPVELYSIRPDGKEMRPITQINGAKLAAIKMGDYEQFSFKGWNKEIVYTYIVKPVDFDSTKKYPVAFLIHGGPQSSFSNHFHYRWNAQVYAGAGYAVVMVDFHGSTGYGQAFTDSIRGDWGGKPLEDLKKGLDAALDRYPWMDGTRVAALGASFGGYMINWIAGLWPDRFRCLVNHCGNFDERMAYFNTEELWFPEWDHEGTPWTNPEGYEKHNPINYVKNWRTPMLVIHGALDFRVVYTQGISTFTALQRLGIPSKFLYFPDEGHWVLKPHNSLFWHETVLGWLDQWCKK